jgi:hypothetical protein
MSASASTYIEPRVVANTVASNCFSTSREASQLAWLFSHSLRRASGNFV